MIILIQGIFIRKNKAIIKKVFQKFEKFNRKTKRLHLQSAPIVAYQNVERIFIV